MAKIYFGLTWLCGEMIREGVGCETRLFDFAVKHIQVFRQLLIHNSAGEWHLEAGDGILKLVMAFF